MHVPTLVALVALASTVLAVYTRGRRPTRRRALWSFATAGLLLVFDTLFICACRRDIPWSEWVLLAACLALVVAAVQPRWLRFALGLGLVAASVVAQFE